MVNRRDFLIHSTGGVAVPAILSAGETTQKHEAQSHIGPKRIPITMCHGIRSGGEKPLTADHLDRLVSIASEMGFASIDYDDLDLWRHKDKELPLRPILFDFDHPVTSMRYEVFDVLSRYGYHGNLFINTAGIEAMHAGQIPERGERDFMTWDEIGELVAAGWHIGAHTVNHPNLSSLSQEDPTGDRILAELVECDATIERRLGIKPRDFAFTGTSWSRTAESAVMQRYRFGRLWIIGSTYQVDGRSIRFAELIGIDGPDEADGGPPHAARYITRTSNPYRLPSMEIQGLIHSPSAFRSYLEGALPSTG
ncbi:MAG: polysaccharide deacetylase family protein [Fuerstiella sp.]|nr:polysaccharide deacetylase family protein [Fuerstiella sp.]